MQMKKEQYVHLALIGLGAVLVIMYLLRESATARANQPIAPPSNADASAQQYPNSSPIQLGDISVGGSPVNISYNTPDGGSALPSVMIGATGAATQDNSGCCDDCPGAGGSPLQLIQKIPQTSLDAAVANMQGFNAKLAFSSFSAAPPEYII